MKLGTMARDVSMLKKMINAEKKSYQSSFALQTVAQVNQLVNGALCLDITPYVNQGSGNDERTGASFKLCSALYEFQLNQQTNNTTRQKLIFEWWIVKGTQLTSADMLTYLFQNSTFSGLVDYNSPRNQDRYHDFKLVRRVKRTLSPDQLTGSSTTLTFNVPMKLNHHVRLVPSPTGVSANCLNGQMFMTVRADVGNKNATASGLTTIPITTALSGSEMRFAYRVWYYDN